MVYIHLELGEKRAEYGFCGLQCSEALNKLLGDNTVGGPSVGCPDVSFGAPGHATAEFDSTGKRIRGGNFAIFFLNIVICSNFCGLFSIIIAACYKHPWECLKVKITPFSSKFSLFKNIFFKCENHMIIRKMEPLKLCFHRILSSI